MCGAGLTVVLPDRYCLARAGLCVVLMPVHHAMTVVRLWEARLCAMMWTGVGGGGAQSPVDAQCLSTPWVEEAGPSG